MTQGLKVEFKGQCLSSVAGKKTAYSRFMTQPKPGENPVEFQVSCVDQVGQDYLWKLCNWVIDGLIPISGVNSEGKSYAYFMAAKITGELAK